MDRRRDGQVAKEKFEEALKRLEELVKIMESGEVTLDDSLKAFEEGIRLIRYCTRKLDEVERKVEILLQDDAGRITAAPLSQED
ncbi:MAG TPA: exodeoxyribonuclease VII small subunit [Syntrophales bacterium]|nr:exodeoxyribonuclease VII small subunit [Syntrophales bacterium]HON23525.1 exodeoxyribonuclease VII small subunit [Syntrophales bacterium]HOU78028.1 exodeoxyribonuclease VII small subunit [Syntrophales bacterium]HQJ30389.1 exodeoxyribonuclease VII small subunit [Syntrophales bacterium]